MVRIEQNAYIDSVFFLYEECSSMKNTERVKEIINKMIQKISFVNDLDLEIMSDGIIRIFGSIKKKVSLIPGKSGSRTEPAELPYFDNIFTDLDIKNIIDNMAQDKSIWEDICYIDTTDNIIENQEDLFWRKELVL